MVVLAFSFSRHTRAAHGFVHRARCGSAGVAAPGSVNFLSARSLYGTATDPPSETSESISMTRSEVFADKLRTAPSPRTN